MAIAIAGGGGGAGAVVALCVPLSLGMTGLLLEVRGDDWWLANLALLIDNSGYDPHQSKY